MNTRLMPPPPGQPDEPLLGLTALAVSPGGKLVAGSYGNGVMISEDDGAGWRFHRAGLPAEGTVTAIVLAPDFDSGGEAALLFEESDYPYGYASAYRSRDGGVTWEGYPGLNAPIQDLVYSPAYATDGVVLAVQGRYGEWRLLRSADRGASWREVLPANGCPLNVALSPDFASDRTALAPRCDHVTVSTDGGLTWADVPLESGDFSRETARMSRLQIIPADPLGYWLIAQIDGQNLPRLSTDGGRHWVKPYHEATLPFTYGMLHGLIVSPNYAHDTSLYAFGFAHSYDTSSRLWRSTDGGRTWAELAHTSTPGCLVNVRASAVLAPNGRLWVATCEGLFHSEDGGRSWRFVHPGGSRVWHPIGPVRSADGVNVALGGRGISRYTSHYVLFEDPGDGWRAADMFAADRSITTIFPSADYRHERMMLVVTTDFAGGVLAMALRLDEQPPLTAMGLPYGGAPGSYQVIYADDYATSGRISLYHGGSGALYRSTDRGRSWTHADPGEPGACLRTPVRGFGALWSANAGVRNRLLCALENEHGYTGLAQPFEHGEMLRLVPDDPSNVNRWVYTLLPEYSGGPALSIYTGIAHEPEPLPTPPPGLVAPDVTLLRAWQTPPHCNLAPGALGDLTGWATEPAHETRFARQYFEGGVMIWRADRDEIIVYMPPEYGSHYVPASCPIHYEVYTDIPGG